MADDQTPENDETSGADPVADAPAQEAEQPQAEADAPAEADADAPVEADADAPIEAQEPPAAEAAADGGEDAGAAAEEPQASEPAEPAEVLTPKQARRRRRSTHGGEARPQRTPEERHAERQQLRAAKAARRRTRRASERVKAAERRKNAPAPEPLAPVHAVVEGARRVRQGIVVSDKADKTITVRIDVARRHRRYEKIVRSSSTLHAHDENNDAHEGDVVRVIESRPLSRTKRWALVDVVERAR
jgi:small subunit ribosomal protein S17